MKNRVAAQSARDRKKATMDGMAKKLAILSEERLKLVRENQQLRNSMQRMREENEKLKKLVSENGMPNEVKNLETVQSMESDEDSVSLASSVASPCASFEPAALINASPAAEAGCTRVPQAEQGDQICNQQDIDEDDGSNNTSRDPTAFLDELGILVAGESESEELLDWLEKSAEELLAGLSDECEQPTNHSLDGSVVSLFPELM